MYIDNEVVSKLIAVQQHIGLHCKEVRRCQEEFLNRFNLPGVWFPEIAQEGSEELPLPTWEEVDDYARARLLVLGQQRQVDISRLSLIARQLSSDLRPRVESMSKIVERLVDYVKKAKPIDLNYSGLTHIDELESAAYQFFTDVRLVLAKNTITIVGYEEIVPFDIVKEKPQAAIQYAFTHFEDALRKRLGATPEMHGLELINAAFGRSGPLSYGATHAERERTRDFLAGAYGLFRNPRNHRLTGDDTGKALSLMVLVGLMLQIVEEAEE